MQSNHETIEGEMSEQLAVESIEHGGCWYDAVSKRWHYGDESKRDGDDQIVCFDPESGNRLNADGTMTEMVPAVTPEAVRATRLSGLLEMIVTERDTEKWGDANRLRMTLSEVGLLCDFGQPTDEARTLFAALAAQSADTARLDALEKHITYSGTGYTDEHGETELDEVHALLLDLENLDVECEVFCDCTTVRDYLDALISQASDAPAQEDGGEDE